jgi:hypothetical protein
MTELSLCTLQPRLDPDRPTAPLASDPSGLCRALQLSPPAPGGSSSGALSHIHAPAAPSLRQAFVEELGSEG